jgi:hypothetical protein
MWNGLTDGGAGISDGLGCGNQQQPHCGGRGDY